MIDATETLDGNASAAVLAEIFVFEVTSAEVECAGCGAIGPVGGLALFGLDMGAVLRCRGCDQVVMRVSHVGGGRWMDFRGMRSMRVSRSG